MRQVGADFLVVDDDALVTRAYCRIAQRFGNVAGALTARDARALLTASAAYDALIIDRRLPDGDGLELLAWVRRRGCGAPALVVTGYHDQDLIGHAFDLNAQYLLKPLSLNRVRHFLRAAVDNVAPSDAGAWAERYGLTWAERSILEAFAAGSSREEIVAEREIEEPTLKVHVRNLLRKTGDASLPDAAMRLLRERAGARREGAEG
jgi:DNA-binding NarL/FixJ family response regulator